MTITAEPEAATVYPVPYGRGLWRLTLHARTFTPARLTASLVSELPDARGRRLEQTLNGSATLTFTLDGRSAAAALVKEMETEAVFWRWDATSGRDVPYFRGVVAQSEDQIGESHTTTFTAHDYLAVLARRYLTSAVTWTGVDQDVIVSNFLSLATAATASGGTSFAPGSFLPLSVARRNPDGSDRAALSGEARDRTYTAQTEIGKSVDDLAHVISIRDPTHNAFDYDTCPMTREPGSASNSTMDPLRVFYPNQGADRSASVVLEYGSTIRTVTRSANSADYGNYIRVIGATPSGAPTDTPPMYAEKWNADANNVSVVPVGLWQKIDSAPDVSVQSTLNEKAAGDLNISGVLVPSYSLGLAPGTYREGLFYMGDSVGIVIRSGRLNVATAIRVVGLSFDVGEDGQEDVSITCGRPLTSLVDMLRAGTADVDALARR